MKKFCKAALLWPLIPQQAGTLSLVLASQCTNRIINGLSFSIIKITAIYWLTNFTKAHSVESTMPNSIVAKKSFFLSFFLPILCVSGITLAGCSCSAPHETRKVRNIADVLIYLYLSIYLHPFLHTAGLQDMGYSVWLFKRKFVHLRKTEFQIVSESVTEQGLWCHPYVTQSNLLSSLTHCNTSDIRKTISWDGTSGFIFL